LRDTTLAFALSLGIAAARGQTYQGTATFATGLSGPYGLAFDTLGNLYVANNGNSAISQVTSGGTVTTFVPNPTSATGALQKRKSLILRSGS
jgi:hypothetical protein